MRQINFNHDWLFTQKDTKRKEMVTLPHDAMINTKRVKDGHTYFLLAGFEGGTYVYTKNVYFPEEYQECDLILEFEAVYCMTTVFINGEPVIEKPYGYTPFWIPLHKYVRFGQENEIRVEANVPKTGHGRWYTGGGIYRPVHLYIGKRNYIKLYGVKVTTESIDPAKVKVDVDVKGTGKIEVMLLDETDTSFKITEEKTVENGKAEFLFEVPDAKLWSAEHPHLYTAQVCLYQDTICIDKVSEQFGIRVIEANPEQGLQINGEPVFLRGGCIHNDNGVIGVINNDATELHRAKILKKSGFNAIRSAHHPMSRSLMKACDKVGLYVMDEAFDHWYRPKAMNPYCGVFMEHFLEDVTAMVLDAYNHPSVILYSIGNEIPEGGSFKGVKVGKAILDKIHQYDQTRLTTFCPSVHWLREYLDGVPYLTEDEDAWMAQSPENKTADWNHYMKIFIGAAANIPEDEKDMNYPPTYQKMDEEATKNLYPFLDVAGYNYYEDKYDVLHQLHPERVLLGTETRGTMYVDTMRYAKTHPFLIGDFIWTLQDHLGEANCCNISYPGETAKPKGNDAEGKDPRMTGKDYPWLINYGGVIDLNGTILPSIHLHEFAWDDQKKGLYLASQPPIHKGIAPKVSSYRWTDTVDGWTYEGYEGKKTWVDVYTDAAFAEILINGKSVGKTKIENYFGKVPCIYEPGILTGIGYDEDGNELYRTSVKTAEKETQITVIPDRTTLSANGEDFAFLDIQITDSNGVLKLLPEHQVSISIEGPGMLQGFGSAYHKNEEPYDQEHHTTYLGKLRAVIRSKRESGTIKVTLKSDGMEPEIITLKTVDEK